MTDAGPVPQRGPGPAFFRRRDVRVALIVTLSIVGSALISMRVIQRYATFPQPPAAAWNEQARQAAGGEQVWLDAGGDRVEAWLLPAAHTQGPAPLMIYAHGNAELIDMRASQFATLRDAGIAVLQVEYPGYGRSQGSPSESSLTAALVAAFDWSAADARFDARRIIGYGRSLGGGAIAQLAARRPLAALVLESTFENFGEVVMAYGVPHWLLMNQFDTRSVLQRYPGPVLVLHGTQDRIFASRHAVALAALSPHASLHLQVCGHNDCPPQWELLLGFLAQNGVCRKPDKETPHESIDVC